MDIQHPPDISATRPLKFKTGGEIMLVGLFLLLLGLTMTVGMIYMGIRLPAEEAPLWVRIALFILAAIPLAFAALGFLLTFGGERITG